MDKIDRMQRQMEQLQEQIKSLKSDMAQAKKKAVEMDAVQGAYAADIARGTAKAPLVKALSMMDHVKRDATALAPDCANAKSVCSIRSYYTPPKNSLVAGNLCGL